MEAILVAVTAIYMGAFGPRFVWRGASMMAVVMIVAGIASTLVAQQEAAAAGLDYRVTPASVAAALPAQILFAAFFYGLAALAHWCHRGLTVGRSAPVPPADL